MKKEHELNCSLKLKRKFWKSNSDLSELVDNPVKLLDGKFLVFKILEAFLLIPLKIMIYLKLLQDGAELTSEGIQGS